MYDSYSQEYVKVICQITDAELKYKLTAVSDGLVDYSFADANSTHTFDKLIVEKGNVIDISGNQYAIDYENDGIIDENKTLTPKDTSAYVPVTKAEINTEEVNLFPGKTQTIHIKVLPDTATNTAVNWHSQDDTIAAVKNGVITGKNTGTTTVFASVTDSDIRFKIKVNVREKAPSSIKVSTLPKTDYIEGEELDLTGGIITITYNDGTEGTIDLSQTQVTGYEKDKISDKQTLSVTYGDFTTTYDVKVQAKSVERIEILKQPNKVQYIEGQNLDITGGMLTAYYNNGKSENIPMSSDMLTGYDMTKPSSQQVTVSYYGKTASFPIEVLKKEVTAIAMSRLPDKISYIIDEPFEFKGAALNVTYNDGEEKVVELTPDMFSQPNMSTTGEKEIQIQYHGLQTAFTIQVRDKVLKEIKIEKLPDKTEYIENETFMADGGRLSLNYDNQTVETIDLTSIMCTVDMSKTGRQNVKVTYSGFETFFEVKIREKQLQSIVWAERPANTKLKEGQEYIPFGKALLTYDNGETESINVDNTNFEVRKFDSSLIGEQTIELVYKNGDLKLDCLIEILAKKVSGLEIIQLPKKTDYIKGETFNPDGLSVLVKYDNDTEEIINGADVKLSPLDMDKTGEQKATVEYDGYEASFLITVRETPVTDTNGQNTTTTSKTESGGDNKAVSDAGSAAVRTGDNSKPLIFAGLLMLGVIGIGFCLKRKDRT